MKLEQPGPETFLQLGDTPDSYAGASSDSVIVKVTEDGLEFGTGGGGGAVISVNGQTGAVVLTTANIAETTNANYVSDVELVVLGNTSGTNTGDQNLFRTIAVSGQDDIVADTTTDTLTLVAGTNVTITTDNTTDTVTISASGGGGGSGLTSPEVLARASLCV